MTVDTDVLQGLDVTGWNWDFSESPSPSMFLSFVPPCPPFSVHELTSPDFLWFQLLTCFTVNCLFKSFISRIRCIYRGDQSLDFTTRHVHPRTQQQFNKTDENRNSSNRLLFFLHKCAQSPFRPCSVSTGHEQLLRSFTISQVSVQLQECLCWCWRMFQRAGSR